MEAVPAVEMDDAWLQRNALATKDFQETSAVSHSAMVRVRMCAEVTEPASKQTCANVLTAGRGTTVSNQHAQGKRRPTEPAQDMGHVRRWIAVGASQDGVDLIVVRQNVGAVRMVVNALARCPVSAQLITAGTNANSHVAMGF